jgi:hypothetical protein
MMRMMVALCAALAAGGAQAMTPLLTCDVGDPQGGFTGYEPWHVADDFVTYQSYEIDSDVEVYVLEQCSTRRQLVLRGRTGEVDAATDAAARAMIDEMVFGEEGYTMSEMQNRLRDLGGVVELRTVGYESCACANQ